MASSELRSSFRARTFLGSRRLLERFPTFGGQEMSVLSEFRTDMVSVRCHPNLTEVCGLVSDGSDTWYASLKVVGEDREFESQDEWLEALEYDWLTWVIDNGWKWRSV